MVLRFICLLLSICFTQKLQGTQRQEVDDRSRIVMVSIAPYVSFIDAIAGDSVKVILLVPPNASFHNFEPTPSQLLIGAKADIWFRVGEPAENRAIQALQSHRPQLQVVDLRNGVDLIIVDPHDHKGHICCLVEGADLHTWLSPKQAKVQAQNIAKALIARYPENQSLYEQRLNLFLSKLDALDQEIRETLMPLKQRTILVGHPAYAYFARDFGLQQLPIEYDGRDPSPKQLTGLLQEARAQGLHDVFVQSQYGTKGASLVANALNGKIIVLNPYGKDYFESMREIAQRIAFQEKSEDTVFQKSLKQNE